jgi:hypothetical protein
LINHLTSKSFNTLNSFIFALTFKNLKNLDLLSGLLLTNTNKLSSGIFPSFLIKLSVNHSISDTLNVFHFALSNGIPCITVNFLAENNHPPKID